MSGQPLASREVSIPDAHPLSLERNRREPGKWHRCWVCAFPPPSGNGFGRERWNPAPVLGLAFPPGPAFPVGNREAGNGGLPRECSWLITPARVCALQMPGDEGRLAAG